MTGKMFSVVTPICPLFAISNVCLMQKTDPRRGRSQLLKLQASPPGLTNCHAYLYRKRRMDIFGVFSKGLSISSTLAIWL
jgi:hypothetical protein